MRRRTLREVVELATLATVIEAFIALAIGYGVMLVAGTLHAIWSAVPALGFWPCVAAVAWGRIAWQIWTTVRGVARMFADRRAA